MAKTISNRKKIQDNRIKQQKQFLTEDIAHFSKLEVTENNMPEIKRRLQEMIDRVSELDGYYKQNAILIDILLNNYELN